MKKYLMMAAIIAALAIIVIGVIVITNNSTSTSAPSAAGQAGAETGTGGTEDVPGEAPRTEASEPSETPPMGVKEEETEPETEHIPEAPIVGKEYNIKGYVIVRDDNGKDWITGYTGSEKRIRFYPSEFGVLKPSAIGPGAFAGMDIEEFSCGGTITEIGERAFENCTKLVSFSTNSHSPKDLTRIGYRAFAGTESLHEFQIDEPDTVTENVVFIEPEVFQGSGIEKIKITGAYQIKARAFADCPHLRELWFPAETMVFANNMIENSPNVIVYCPNYSKAMEWCKEHVVMAMDSGKTRGDK